MKECAVEIVPALVLSAPRCVCCLIFYSHGGNASYNKFRSLHGSLNVQRQITCEIVMYHPGSLDATSSLYAAAAVPPAGSLSSSRSQSRRSTVWQGPRDRGSAA